MVVVVVEIAGSRARRRARRCARSGARLDRILDRPVRLPPGRPGSGLARPVVGPVDRVRNRISRFGAFSLLFFPKPNPNRPKRRETMELEAQSWGNSRSSTTTPDPRTKTTQNATKSQIGQEAIWGYFWGFFFFGKFSRNEIGWVEGQIRDNHEL